MQDVPIMEKDGKNNYHNYSYLSDIQVTLEMRKLLNKHGVIFIVNKAQCIDIDKALSDTGKSSNMVKVLIEYSLIDVDSGERFDNVIEGHAQDSGDKGIYKAITGGIKYIFMKNFMIPTGDDPDRDNLKKAIKKSPQKNQQEPTTDTAKKVKTIWKCQFMNDTEMIKKDTGVITNIHAGDWLWHFISKTGRECKVICPSDNTKKMIFLTNSEFEELKTAIEILDT